MASAPPTLVQVTHTNMLRESTSVQFSG